ncbi:exported hypothetical protein [Mesorhizobium sp. ORS 3324]|nr:exported hypothetical protein [Mesorhizobium sp. ORS 3324]
MRNCSKVGGVLGRFSVIPAFPVALASLPTMNRRLLSIRGPRDFTLGHDFAFRVDGFRVN